MRVLAASERPSPPPSPAGGSGGRLLLALLGCWFAGVAWAAPDRVSFPSLDGAGRAPVVLTGAWFAARVSGPAPAVVLLHGCGGAYDRRGRLAPRFLQYAKLLNEHGIHALVVDSLGPRWEVELCTQRIGSRRVTQANRRLDALGAVAYLAERPDVEPKRIGLMGWSNGGSTVLAATNLRHHDVADSAVKPAFAIAFYPGCESDLRRGYEASSPLLMLTGLADDWTPAATCATLAREATGIAPELVAYPGAHHGFDSDLPLRLRTDVPNGANPGKGVHVGGNASAWRESREKLLRFLGQQLAKPTS